MGRSAALLLALVLGLGTPSTVPGAAPAAGATTAPALADPVTRLQPAGSGVGEAEIGLAGRLGERIGTSRFSMVAVTWTGARPPGVVRLRWRGGGAWRGWRTLPALTDLPEAAEQGARHGTQPLWTGPAEGVQVVVKGHRPRGLRLVLLDTTAGEPLGRSAASGSVRPAERARPGRAPRPALHTRAAWRANPRWRNGSPSYIRKIQQVHIHHTVTANDYRRADVPGILRGIYRYHTRSLGWFDIGYNFIVDRFGRAWVGRSGGAGRAVRGAHTLGFNHESTGVALLGRFGRHEPSRAAIRAVVRLAAWKLDRYGVHPRRSVVVRSRGSDRFPARTWVRLPAIDGHRDTNQTSCPGGQVYERLKDIRRRAARRVRQFGS